MNGEIVPISELIEREHMIAEQVIARIGENTSIFDNDQETLFDEEDEEGALLVLPLPYTSNLT